MLKKNLLFILVMTTLAVLTKISAHATSPGDPAAAKYAEKISSDIKANWIISGQLPSPVQIVFEVADDGTIYNPDIEKTCGDAQLDGECLSAVCTSSPLQALPFPLRTGKTFQLAITFEPNTNARKAAALAEYRRAHNFQKFEFCTFRIPPIVLSRFPGALKENEIYSLKNFRKSDSGDIVSASHLWSMFFKEHPHATRNELLNGPSLI